MKKHKFWKLEPFFQKKMEEPKHEFVKKMICVCHFRPLLSIPLDSIRDADHMGSRLRHIRCGIAR